MPVTVRTFVRRLVIRPARERRPEARPRRYLIEHVERWRVDLDQAEGPLALARFLDVGSRRPRLHRGGAATGPDRGGRPSLTLASGPFWVGGRRAAARTRPDPRGAQARAGKLPGGRTPARAGRPAGLPPQRLRRRPDRVRAGPAIAEPLGDEPTVASSQIFSGGILLVTGEIDRGRSWPGRRRVCGSSRPLPARRRGRSACGRSPTRSRVTSRTSGRCTSARLAVARAHGDVARTADALEVLAEIALDEADAATARSYAEEALAIAQPGLPVEAREALIALARAAVAERGPHQRGGHARAGLRGGREDRPEAGDRPVLPRRRVPGRGAPRARRRPCGCSLPPTGCDRLRAAPTCRWRRTCPEDWTPLVHVPGS